jgi:uncharacterized protein YyaL (SSP411 family)
MNRNIMKSLIVIILTVAVVNFWPPGQKYSQATEADRKSSQKGVKHNRLIDESSPYLLQHATNPVDWYPWGNEAFEKARKEDKPIFLSIGYSTCHWCHVMEEESFADEEVAALLNKYFVSIKVDREERPDIDRVYMAVTQAITGRGGWPNNIFLTPDKKPFLAGTYFPKKKQWGLPGLLELLPKVAEVWQNDRQKLLGNAEKITGVLTDRGKSDSAVTLNPDTLNKARHLLAESFDPEYGGFGQAPKFPSPHKLTFLLRRYHYQTDAQALAMVEKTLTQMRYGGIYDHIGFGFHRYSTDAQWLVPHFEKMLYDQALLAVAYTEAYQATGKPFYARTVREIFAYVLRDMTSREGGFYSAEDADSEGIEGKFYLWTTGDIQKIIGDEDYEVLKKTYNLDIEGNFTSQEADQPPGSNILHLENSTADLAAEWDISEKKLLQELEKNRQELFNARIKRIHPFKDDKILTDWNGLMVAALAKAGRVLEEPQYISVAEKAAGFILLKLQDKNGRLMKRYRQGKAGLPAFLDDYAFVVWGLLELYETTHKTSYLREAVRLSDQMITHFWDVQNGGLFMTSNDSEKLLFRDKQIYDGAIPSGNSVAAMNLLRLGHITGETDYLKKAESITKTFSVLVEKYPSGHAYLMMALEYALNPNYEVVFAGNIGASDTETLLKALHRPFIPGKIVVFLPTDKTAAAEIIKLVPYTEFMVPIDGKATAYVCMNSVCQLPTTDVSQMLANLQAKKE